MIGLMRSNGLGWPNMNDVGRPPMDPQVTWRRILGVDLGQSGDPSAAALLEQATYAPAFIGPRDERAKIVFQRWPLRTDYCQVVQDILTYDVDCVVVEYNGVGRPVIDMLRNAAHRMGWRGSIRPVVTAASNVRQKTVSERGQYHYIVPKPELVSAIEILRQGAGMVLAPGSETAAFLGEIDNFQYRISSQKNVQMGNVPGVGKHDDLVIALGLACWWATRFGTRKLRMYNGR